ncbi:SusC/RagA family TonB-linked outer membrane protein [Flavobacterium sp.]|uniref:SusC/RagA family TonB-linked outer membrane protein n=1 Tax=Flavobacterium sp. TaxID=239 RepID=UPI003B9D8778
MRFKFKWLLTIAIVFTTLVGYSQKKSISGVVTDGKMPLPGVTVAIKGTNEGASTDLDGKYSISAAAGDVLEFSFIGMKTKSVTVGASSTINVSLQEDVQVLTEVQLVSEGYNRTSTKARTTGASATISSETIQNRPNASFFNSLQGQIAGLNVISSSGSPGSGQIDLIVRGVGSINASLDPLIVIDGVPTAANQFRNLNQNDIETATLLKDSYSTSIYGNRGANGVLVITTKSAKYGSSLKVSYDGMTGVSRLPSESYNLSNAKQALTIENRFGLGLGASLTQAQIDAYQIDTNWRDQFFNQDIFQQHNVGLTFGGANTSNYTSFNYFEQGGLVPTTDFQRFTVRNNFNGRSANEKFTYSSQFTIGFSRRNQLAQETNSGIDNNTIQNPLQGALLGLPYLEPSPYLTGQELFDGIGFNFNGANDTYVLEDILRGSVPNEFTETSALANFSAGYKLSKTLSIQNKFGVDYRLSRRIFARDPRGFLAIAVRESREEEFGGFESHASTRDVTFTNIASLNYSKTFKDKHRIDAGLYMEYTKVHVNGNSFTQNGLNEKTWSFGAGTGYIPFDPSTPNSYLPAVSASKITAGTLSYFGTFDYDYSERFGAGLVLRRDASYRFVEDNKWATFWAISGRWNIDKEAFMKDTKWRMLKLRASYGTQGNQNVLAAGYGTNALVTGATIVRDLYGTGAGYDASSSGSGFTQLGNPTLAWEEQSQSNVGLDFNYNNKLEGTIDVYERTTRELYAPDFLSAGTGQYSQNANNGTLRNRGIELLLRYQVLKGADYGLKVFVNGAYNQNEIRQINDPGNQAGNSTVLLPGRIVNEWNLIPYVGVNQSNGNLLFLDRNGNVTENPDPVNDRRLTGKSAIPVYTGGFGLNADFKNFFLDAQFSYALEVYRYDNQMRWANLTEFIGQENVSADMLNAWTIDNPSNYPALNATNYTFDSDSTRWLKDSSFLRLKNVSFGYNVPRDFLAKTFFTSMKIFVQGENLLTWTKWRGFDPESISASLITGYPNPQTLSFGVSAQF